MISNLDSYIKEHNIKAFVFDLNGTIINDMEYHSRAWFNMFSSLGVNLSYADAVRESYGKNEEVIERVMPNVYSVEERTKIGLKKEEIYRSEYLPELALIDGFGSFIEKYSQQGMLMAIGSAAIMINIDFVINNCNIRHYFQSIVSAEQVAKSKPDPETFLKCADELNVNPEQCIVFEDSPKGLESGLRANMHPIVITTTHKVEEFKQWQEKIVGFIEDYR